MFKIGEFSQLGQVTIRTLRHYDDLGLLKPAHVDRDSDYRYYTVDQLPRLNRILALKDLGFALDQIALMLHHDLSSEELRGMLQLRQAEIEQQLQEDQVRLARVASRLRQIEHEGEVSRYEVVIKHLAPQTIISLRTIVPELRDITPYRCSMYDDLYLTIEHLRLKVAGPELALYHNPEYIEQDIDMELAVPIERAPRAEALGERFSVRTLPAAPQVASVIHQGDLWDIGQAMVALVVWLGANERAANGPYREVHLYGRENDPHDLSNVVVEMQIPLG
ncbi:MAG: MerR family transcriptional regulator [Ktedonobacterales bacterium]|nr:MerR family transcriptional regulator [Ktedonobacterales bacterium]